MHRTIKKIVIVWTRAIQGIVQWGYLRSGEGCRSRSSSLRSAAESTLGTWSPHKP